MKAKELARVMELPGGRYRELRRVLEKLEAEGEVYRTRTTRYALPHRINLMVGRLSIIRSGDGFVTPSTEADARGDVFVPAAALESAMDGDQVVVRVEGHRRGPRPVGQVIRVLERAHPTLVGVFQEGRRFGYVVPRDRKAPRDVLIPDGDEGDARAGDVVVVRITQYGDGKLNPVGEVERVLGPADDPGVDVLSILFGHGLPLEFPPEVEAAAVEAAERAASPGERVDRTDLHVFTIDPADAKDHDDALSVESAGKGEWEVGIHIADVSHFVQAGSPLDVEALNRGTSVYLVDRVVPMLPHLLSSDLCSLRPREDRLAVSLFVRLNGEGDTLGHRFERTVIRSRNRLAYEEVQAVLDGGGGVDEPTDAALRILRELARKLRSRRERRGSLDFDLPEARVVLDEEGIPVSIERRPRLESHRLIEDFMLLANEVVARRAAREEVPLLYRIHEAPTERKLEQLREFLLPLGVNLPDGTPGPSDLQKVLNQVQGRPEEGLVSNVVLRSMARARYSPENRGHFGLAARFYSHFTSPIRRYPDLMVHRAVVLSFIQRQRVPGRWGEEDLASIAAQSSEREALAQAAERDSIELKKVEFMERHLGEEFEGTVAGVTVFGFFVLLDSYFVEGLVHVSTLGDDFYRFREGEYALVGERRGRRFRLGDRVKVQVARVDREERRIDLHLVEVGREVWRGGTGTEAPKSKGGKARKGKKGSGGRRGGGGSVGGRGKGGGGRR